MEGTGMMGPALQPKAGGPQQPPATHNNGQQPPEDSTDAPAANLIQRVRFGTNICMVANLPDGVLLQDMIPNLSQYGAIEHTVFSGGWLFLKYENRECVQSCIKALDGSLFREAWPDAVPALLQNAEASAARNQAPTAYGPAPRTSGKIAGGGMEKLRMQLARQRVAIWPGACQSDFLAETSFNHSFSEHVGPDGTSYYYDCYSGESQWELPPTLGVQAMKAQDPTRLRRDPYRTFVTRALAKDDLPCTLFICHLPSAWSEKTLRVRFQRFGKVKSAVVQYDEAGVSRCFGYVSFEKQEHAASAKQNLHRFLVEKAPYRILHVELMRHVSGFNPNANSSAGG